MVQVTRASRWRRDGYEVTIVDRSSAMFERAERLIASEENEVAERLSLVEAAGEGATDVLGGQRFGAVLCHGVLMSLEDPTSLVSALCALVDGGGIV